MLVAVYCAKFQMFVTYELLILIEINCTIKVQMATFDNIPNIQKGKNFPVGDIFDHTIEKNVEKWFRSVSDMSHKTFINYIETHNPYLQTQESSSRKTVLAAMGVCHSWDDDSNSRRKLSSEGFKIASAFIQNTEYLPECSVDLSEDIRRIALPEGEGGYLHEVRKYGRTAWNSIAIYPNVHLTFERILELTEDQLGITETRDRDTLKAGLALRAMMSWAGQLVELTPKFTSVKFTYEPVTSTNFHTFFSADTPLASNNICERNK